jgi:hypothetical protein
MVSSSANIKNTKQSDARRDMGMSNERAATIANSPDAAKHGQVSGKGGSAEQGDATARHEAVRAQAWHATASRG